MILLIGHICLTELKSTFICLGESARHLAILIVMLSNIELGVSSTSLLTWGWQILVGNWLRATWILNVIFPSEFYMSRELAAMEGITTSIKTSFTALSWMTADWMIGISVHHSLSVKYNRINVWEVCSRYCWQNWRVLSLC